MNAPNSAEQFSAEQFSAEQFSAEQFSAEQFRLVVVSAGTSDPSSTRLLADRTAERGLVERCADPADGRGVRLSLTDAGRVVQRRIGRQHARGVARAMTAGLTAAELAQLETICRKLAAAPMAATDTSEVLI